MKTTMGKAYPCRWLVKVMTKAFLRFPVKDKADDTQDNLVIGLATVLDNLSTFHQFLLVLI
jgi:hypothetical protein